MDELLIDFKTESSDLIHQMMEILETVETDHSQQSSLERYGQFADRIMGGAKSLLMAIDTGHDFITMISNYTELCKAVGYQASQIEDNNEFLNIVIALLLDGTEVLEQLVETVGTSKSLTIQEVVTETFLERLKWVSKQFDQTVRTSVAVDKDAKKKLNQDQINALLKQLGL